MNGPPYRHSRQMNALEKQGSRGHLDANCSQEISFSTKRGSGGIQYRAVIMANAMNPMVETVRVIFQWDMKILLSMVTYLKYSLLYRKQ